MISLCLLEAGARGRQRGQLVTVECSFVSYDGLRLLRERHSVALSAGRFWDLAAAASEPSTFTTATFCVFAAAGVEASRVPPST